MAATDWSNIASGVTAFAAAVVLVGGIGGLKIGPIENDISLLREDIKDINRLMAPLLTLNAQHVADLAAASAQDQANLDKFARIQKDIDGKLDVGVFNSVHNDIILDIEHNKEDTLRTLNELDHQVHDLEAEIVSRSENAQHWISDGERMTSLERRLDALTLLVENGKPPQVMQQPDRK